ncbi:MAG TPA: hypothetical protein VEU51_14225 [Candidatus Acidoferrales bacterium]|nr:hypothetical protein [Candidatus Acidoferrales bacterium]
MKRFLRKSSIWGALGLAVAAVFMVSGSQRVSAAGVIPNGALMVSIGNGFVQEWDTTTTPPTFVALLNTMVDAVTAGSMFDIPGNFYVTDFNGSDVTKFDPTGALLGDFGSGYAELPESITPNAAGDFFVGQAGVSSTKILEFGSLGAPIMSFAALVEDRGTDWIDLAKDQCTLFYTSEDLHVLRFDVCANIQLPLFAGPLPGPNAYTVKIRQNGEVMVGDTTEVIRLDAAGNPVQHYLASSIEPSNKTPLLFGLTLPPDGTTFWTADLNSFDVFHVDIATGAVLTHFNTVTDCTSCGDTSAVAGLTIKGEITPANPPPDCSHAVASAPTLWPPNHKFVPETVLGVTDVSAAFTINIDAIDQDEPVLEKGEGAGNTCPDGEGVGTNTALIRSERSGHGDGRVYHIDFTATDTNGNTCSSDVSVCVPHDQGHGAKCVDEGELFDSTVCPGPKRH